MRDTSPARYPTSFARRRTLYPRPNGGYAFVPLGLVALTLVLLLGACGVPADPAADLPTPPGDVRAEAVDGHVLVTWTDRSDDETGFVVHADDGTVASSLTLAPAARVELGRTGPDATTFRAWGLPADVAHVVTVSALSEAGEGEAVATEDGAVTVAPVALRADLATLGLDGEMADAAIARFEAEHPAVTVTRLLPDEVGADRFGYYQEILTDGTYHVDVAYLDVVWTGAFADALIDLNEHGAAGTGDAFLGSTLDNGTHEGRLVALPWFMDMGLLYYRTDLLAEYGYAAPPVTWEELETMAGAIQEGERTAGNADFWGYVWQGADTEALTCNALEWLASSGGGTIIRPDGVITVDNDEAVGALERAAGWVGTISPPDVTTWAEENSRGVWQAGDAAFMRNWAYANSLGQANGSAVRDLFGVAPLPSGGASSAATLGGWHLGVSAESPSPNAATRFVLFLASEDEQRTRAVAGSYWPTRPALYDDADVLASLPNAAGIAVAAEGAVARPSTAAGADYAEVSAAVRAAVHEVLTGAASAADAAAELEADLVSITGFEAGGP